MELYKSYYTHLKSFLYMTIVELSATISGALAGVWAFWSKVLNPFLRKEKKKKEDYRKKIDDIHVQIQSLPEVKNDVKGLKAGMARIEERCDSIDENQKLSMNLQEISYWVSDAEGEFTYVSPALCKLMGKSESELLGSNWISSVVYEDRKRVVDAWTFSVAQQSGFDEIFSIRRPDGMYVKVWAIALPKAGKKVFGGTMGKMNPLEVPHPNKN